jgi:predicted transport protein
LEKGLLEKTGKSLEHWIDVVKQSKIEKHKAIIDFLKSEHNFSYGFANFVSMKARQTDAESIDDNDLLEGQYKGKENLRPIYDKLLNEINKLGSDIKVVPKNGSVSFIRKHQFVLIKPATKTRIDLGLKIKDKSTTKRLEKSGPFGSMCTHRVQITSEINIDSELMSWIKEAYDKSV